MGPEFNEKLQWARYLQLQNDEERRKEKVRIARIEEELKKQEEERKKEEENKDVENKYMNYNVEEQEENSAETENDKKPGFTGEILDAAFSLLFFGGILGTLFWIFGCLISGG